MLLFIVFAPLIAALLDSGRRAGPADRALGFWRHAHRHAVARVLLLRIRRERISIRQFVSD